MKSLPDMTFPELAQLEGFDHRFLLRCPLTPCDADRAEVLARLRPRHLEAIAASGWAEASLREAEQVHGAEVAVVTADSPALALGADGLISQQPDVLLGIYVADCCAVYLTDPTTQAIGLVHAGRKGAELGIVPKAIGLMTQHFGCLPSNVIVQLSPCIRPPDYEVDFAALIRRQCLEAGIVPTHLHDIGLNTAADLRSFYSYRVEKGRTGRMLALLGRRRTC